MPEDRKTFESILEQMGIHAKSKRYYTRDFSKYGVQFQTGVGYPYNGENPTAEPVEWVLYAGNVPKENDANTLIILGEYYPSGMMQDIFLFFNRCDAAAKVYANQASSYLYLDEANANLEATLGGKNGNENPAYWSRLRIHEILETAGDIIMPLKDAPEEYFLKSPIDITRSQFLQRIISQPLFKGSEIAPSSTEMLEYVQAVWKEVIQ